MASQGRSDQNDKHLWEILVPAANKQGIPFTEDHHNSFRRVLRLVSGGTTRNAAADGDWEHEGTLFSELMIPMRFRACRADAQRMAEHARGFYNQIEIMAYKVTDANDIIYVEAKVAAEALQASEQGCTCLMSKVVTGPGPHDWHWAHHKSCPVACEVVAATAKGMSAGL